MQLREIYMPIQKDLEIVEDRLRSIGVVETPWLDDLLSHALKGGGKRLRPALVLLSASFYDYNVERLMPMALAVEIMHLATLVHDDTIDNSFVRWGNRQSTNCGAWKRRCCWVITSLLKPAI